MRLSLVGEALVSSPSGMKMFFGNTSIYIVHFGIWPSNSTIIFHVVLIVHLVHGLACLMCNCTFDRLRTRKLTCVTEV